MEKQTEACTVHIPKALKRQIVIDMFFRSSVANRVKDTNLDHFDEIHSSD